MGAKAEGSERPGRGRNRRKTGRKTRRMPARTYRAILHETWLRGHETAVSALRSALQDGASRLGWTRAQRAQTVLRLDGGFGTTAVRNWVWSRSYQVVAKMSHRGRVRTWRHPRGPWQSASRPGREMAPVVRPHRFCRATRQGGMRPPLEQGGYPYAGLLTPVTDLEPAAVAEAYAGRAMMAATFGQDTHALGLVKRGQHTWAAQHMVVLLARLAQPLLLWRKRWLSQGPATR
jgi:hypothetical protein